MARQPPNLGNETETDGKRAVFTIFYLANHPISVLHNGFTVIVGAWHGDKAHGPSRLAVIRKLSSALFHSADSKTGLQLALNDVI